MIYRYDRLSQLQTLRDPLEDLSSQLMFFKSEEYTTDLLHKTRGLARAQAKSRHRLIAAHANASYNYIEAAMSGPKEVSFLSLYYAALNLAKLYILLSQNYNKLTTNRTHGAQYDVHAKQSRSLMTEQVKLRSGGVIPLFYKTITGSPISDKHVVNMRDVYPFLHDISHEFTLATGDKTQLLPLRTKVERKNRLVRITLTIFRKSETISSRSIPLIKNMRKKGNGVARYYSKYEGLNNRTINQYADSKLRRFMLYGPYDDNKVRRGEVDVFTPHSSRKLYMFEELAIFLSLFHIGSICRYKPDFYDKVLDSNFGPVVISARSNLIIRFLILFWSYAHHSHHVIQRI